MSNARRRWWRLRRLIDRDLVENRRPASLAVALLPLVIAGWGRAGPIGWSLAAATTLLAFALMAWRGWRLFRAHALRDDCHYDRATRIILAPEYRRTNSASRGNAPTARSRSVGYTHSHPSACFSSRIDLNVSRHDAACLDSIRCPAAPRCPPHRHSRNDTRPSGNTSPTLQERNARPFRNGLSIFREQPAATFRCNIMHLPASQSPLTS